MKSEFPFDLNFIKYLETRGNEKLNIYFSLRKWQAFKTPGATVIKLMTERSRKGFCCC